MSKGKVGNGDDEVSEFGEGVYGGRQADKDGKGKGNREGKCLKQEVEHGKGRRGKGGRRIMCVVTEEMVPGDACAGDSDAASIGVWGDGNGKAFDAGADQVMGLMEESFQDCKLGDSVHGTKVELNGEEVSTEVGNRVRARMGEWERAEMARRVAKKS
ncbi:hypothetical protein Cgig2_017456 [Carnegiea gigantea]|uniref:Uncharacterized protein n=1 Tax=Carnegiea gigantea TaxID=171969 RepID=A0A9Q1JLE3_9CARY|nr:hypothetical protein Cgig2_017456 [Carnegiea gigantea]